jgi:lipopolysaccharide/colanic/teichoic acid biosynthesis glycosyltransferase
MRALAHRFTARSVTLIVFETVLLVSAIVAAAYLRMGDAAWEALVSENGPLKILLIVGVAQTCLYYADLYDLRVVSDRRELFIRIIQALASASFILAAIYFWFPSLVVGRGVFILAAVLSITLVVGWRVAFEWLSGQAGPRERILLVGTSPATVELARELFERRHELGVEIVGFIDPNPERLGTVLINPGVIGAIDDIPAIVRDKNVDRVVVSLSEARGTLPVDKLLDMRLSGVTFDHLASVYEEYTGKIAVENLRPSWFIFSDGFRKTRVLAASKRTLDLVAASIGLVLALPLMAIVWLAIRLTSDGPPLYHQERVGLNGRVFTVHKFRSMRVDAEATTGPVWASKDGDTRVTPIGGFLRRCRIDEIPQLWNVLIGQRHGVRPGLTGWAQVSYTYGATTEDALQKLQYDLYYIKNLSIALDLFVILQTVKTVVLRRGA